MTASLTRSACFTITDARYVGAKVGADLRLLHNLYGRPALERHRRLRRGGRVAAEATATSAPSTTASATPAPMPGSYGCATRATAGGQLVDSRPGSFPRRAAVDGYAFYSYLTYSAEVPPPRRRRAGTR